jgi:hypothetical protein
VRGERTDFERLLTIDIWCRRLADAAIQPSSDAALSLAATPVRIAAMRRTLAAATPAARLGIDEVSCLLDLDPQSFRPDGVESSPLLGIAGRFGAIARAGQIVVVGDQKQLPPSSFFDRLVADENGADDDIEAGDLLGGAAKLGELESILTLCEARGLGSRMLKWHYRSPTESLYSDLRTYKIFSADSIRPYCQDDSYGHI